MRYPTRKLFGFTWVGWLNFLLAQWFWLRLQGEVDEDSDHCQWQVIAPVAPLTGWKKHSYWPPTRRTFHLTRLS